VSGKLRRAFEDLLAHRSLGEEQMNGALQEVFEQAPPDTLIAGFLVALRLKGETGAELTGAARAMLAVARPLDLGMQPLLDTAGTGGDGLGTLNISTAAALVAAGAGAQVAKHGNRAVSGRCGGADVLEHLGVKLDPGPAVLRTCLRRAGICFVFAPAYHPLMARLAPLRRELAVRTLFNLLGPLANPARPRRQLTGVAERALLAPMAQALAALGAEHALVVNSDDGLDEISAQAPTLAIEVRAGQVTRQFKIHPTELIADYPTQDGSMSADSPAAAAELLKRTLAGKPGSSRTVVALNAGAAIYVAGRADSLAQGVAIANEVLNFGQALDVLEALRRTSHEVAPTDELNP
jgi:anthranilate phosphoribosyltransferase